MINGERLVRLIDEQKIPLPVVTPRTREQSDTMVQSVSGNSRAPDVKGVGRAEEIKHVERRVKDDGAYITLELTKAVEEAKDYLRSEGAQNVQLEDVVGHMKRLYVFRAKASYRLNGRKSVAAELSVDADGNVREGIPTLVKTVSFDVEYERTGRRTTPRGRGQ